MAHKIIWLYVYGEAPQSIDHIDGDGLNNKIDNLRIACHAINNKNRSLSRVNKTGISGVSWIKARSKFEARISDNGKEIFLGRFNNIFDAAVARKSAEIRFNYHANHGRIT